MKENLGDKFKKCPKCKKYYPKSSKYCVHCERNKIVYQMEKDLKEKPPFGIQYKSDFKAMRMSTKQGIKSNLRRPIYKTRPSLEFMFDQKINPKTHKKVHLDKDFKDNDYIDLEKVKKCSNCKRYISKNSEFCIYCTQTKSKNKSKFKKESFKMV